MSHQVSIGLSDRDALTEIESFRLKNDIRYTGVQVSVKKVVHKKITIGDSLTAFRGRQSVRASGRDTPASRAKPARTAFMVLPVRIRSGSPPAS